MSLKHPEHKLGMIMLFAAWGILLGILTYFFHIWHVGRENPNQDIQGLVLSDGSSQVILKSNYQHHYVATGKINDHEVTFLLDTGATSVVVSKQLADKIGLKYGTKQLAITASGTTEVYMTTLQEVQLGNIRLNKVKANINTDMDPRYVLLGMSALKRLHIEQKQNELILTLPIHKKDN